MQKYIKIVSGLALSALSFLVSLPVLAVAQLNVSRDINVFEKTTSLLELVKNWFTGIVAIVAVIMILYAAFLFVTAGGEEEKLGKAKSYLMYGIVGVAVALLAYGIISIVSTTLGL